MQKYSTYKPSNIEWLGDVPSHWKVSEIKHDLEFTTGFTPPTSNAELFDGDITWVTIADMDQKYISNSKTKLTAEAVANAKAQIIPKGSLLYSFKLSIGKVAFAETDLYTNEAIACFLPNVKFNPNFLYYAFETYLHNYGKENIYGALLLNREIIKAAKITYPKFTEQTAIAAYLDQATANIDKVIATKQKQLEKLEQYKQSKIHECVTKGLNPDVTLKPSGIDWIGDVPVHWKVERVKDVVQLRTEKTSEKSEVKDYLELEDMEQWTGKIMGFRDTTEVSSDVTMFRKGDILFGKLRPYLAKYWLADRDGKCTGEIIAFNCLKIQNVFFKHFIGSPKFIELCTAVSYGAKMPRVDWTRQIAYFYISFPDKEEQIEIANYIEEFTDKISKEKSIINQQIEKLEQYRKCLIHECVTGKRKVID